MIRWAIDIGTSAHGIVIYEIDENGRIKRILWFDEVIFGEPVEAKTSATLNSSRRMKRLMRHQIANRASRLRKLGHLATALGVTKADFEALKKRDVYALRFRALHEKITLAELMRVFFHIAKHRGYRGDLSDGVVKKAIAATEKMLEENSSETLGELWYHLERQAHKARRQWQILSPGKKNGGGRGTFIRREDVVAEWEKIFEKQASFHPELRREYDIRHESYFTNLAGRKSAPVHDVFASAIFYQRPIKWNRGSIGVCRYEPGWSRCVTSQIAYQKYRIAKVLSDLKLTNRRTGETRGLTPDECRHVFDAICAGYESYDKTRKSLPKTFVLDELGLSKKDIRLNFDVEDDGLCGNSSIRGVSTIWLWSKVKCLGAWDALTDREQQLSLEFLSCVTQYRDIVECPAGSIEKSLKEIVRPSGKDWRASVNATEADIPGVVDFLKVLEEKKAFAFSGFKLEIRRSSYSIPVLEKLTERLLAGQCEYDALAELYPQAKKEKGELRPFEELKIGNPVIDKALKQLERMVKYARHRFGRPDEIVVELSREMKNSLPLRAEIEKRNTLTEKVRLEAFSALEEQQLFASGYRVEKYLLWQELVGGKCPYCGSTISLAEALGRKTEIDHIIPQGSGGANNMDNKVLCCSSCNLAKGNRTPQLWLQSGSAPAAMAQACEELAASLVRKYKKDGNRYQRGYARKAENLRTGKSLEELQEDFSERQNIQTAWIGKIVLDYLGDICDNVSPSYGMLTAHVWHFTGMDTLLPEIRLAKGRKLFSVEKKVMDSELYRKVFLNPSVFFGFLSQTPEKPEEAAAQNTLRAMFAQYKEAMLDSPESETTDAQLFDRMIREMRSRAELGYDKRCDHRHHIVDAAVIGLCSRSLVQKANTYYAKVGMLNEIKSRGIEPFRCDNLFDGNFRSEWKRRLTGYVVWHKPDHYPDGAFADGMAYNIKPSEADGKMRFVRRQTVAKLLEKGEGGIESVVVNPKTKELLLNALAKGEESIRIRGNEVKQVKVFYKERFLLEYKPDLDLLVETKAQGTTHRKYYQNAGYACAEFDRRTGRCIRLISLLEYRREAQTMIPKHLERIYKGDIVYDRKAKSFQLVKKFSIRELRMSTVAVTDASPDAIETSYSSIKELEVIRAREQIGELLRQRK